MRKQYKIFRQDYLKYGKSVKKIQTIWENYKKPSMFEDKDNSKLRSIIQKETFTTDWMEICRSLDKEYKLSELKIFAHDMGISTEDKNKRQLCAELSESFETLSKNNRHCHNESLLGDDYDGLEDTEIIEYIDKQTGNNFCFTLEELNMISDKYKKLNPYTTKPIPKEVWDEYEYKVKIKEPVHKLKLRGIR
jgi:hypothetical protein